MLGHICVLVIVFEVKMMRLNGTQTTHPGGQSGGERGGGEDTCANKLVPKVLQSEGSNR